MSAVKGPEPSYSAARAAMEAAKAAQRATPLAKACAWIVDNQEGKQQAVGWSLALLALIHAHDRLVAGNASPVVHLKHRVPGDAQGRYYRGADDVYYIAYWVVAFTLIRIVAINRVLIPFARACGVRSARKLTRFGEQGWLTVYYILSLSAGLYVMAQGPHWMNTAHFWIGYPDGHREMTALMKSYYLVQMGFWFQQIFVLLVEEKRKDFVVMFVHHIVTCNLMGWSLYMNYTRIGNAILCCMDSSDIFLSGTKCMRYLGLERLSVGSFVVFVLSWIYTRHYLYMKIVLSIVYEAGRHLGDDIWDPENGSFYSRRVMNSFIALLLILQCLIIYWLALVLRIIYRIIFQRNLEDSRSDSEDAGDHNHDHHHKAKKTN